MSKLNYIGNSPGLITGVDSESSYSKAWFKFKRQQYISSSSFINFGNLRAFSDFLLAARYSSTDAYLVNAIRLESENANLDSSCTDTNISALRRAVSQALKGLQLNRKKSPPMKLDMIRTLSGRLRDIALFLVCAGLRIATVVEIKRRHVRLEYQRGTLCGLNMSVRKDKTIYLRDLHIGCTCKSNVSNFCILHSISNLKTLFPIRDYEVENIYKRFQLSMHSFRRSSALCSRLIYERLPKRKREQFVKKINVKMGWSPRSIQFFEYSTDYENYCLDDFACFDCS